MSLSAVEARILGALIEKSFTTPEQYPLSFSALLGACNQKTSREPVMQLSTEELAAGIKSLAEKSLVVERVGSRVPKYSHYAEHLGAGDTPEALGVVALLLLRGPQTTAELRVRGARIAQYPDNAAVDGVLLKFLEHEDGPLVARLSRGRFQQLFTGPAQENGAAAAPPREDRLSALEKRVARLEERCRALEDKPGNPH